MKHNFSFFFRCFMLTTLPLTFQATAAESETINHSPIRLSGHVPSKALSNATYLKNLDETAHVPITFILPLRNKEALEKLVERMYDPNDEQHYGKYLTPEEFAEQFAPTEEDYENIIAYAKSLGLNITGTHSNRTLLHTSGPTRSIETAFNLCLHHYQKPDGRTFYAPNNDPEVPHFIAPMIHGIVGLDNHAVWRTFNQKKQAAEEFLYTNAASNAHPSGPRGGYSPNDLVTAYNLNGLPANGSGQIIALFELGGYQESDINEYTSYFGLPSPKLKNILVRGGSGSGINPEVTLDIELAIALAPESQIYIYEGPNSDQGVLDTYNRIATDNLARQVSTSWGLGENLVSAQYLQAENAIFLQMAAHGQTIYAAAGDSGAYDNYANSSSLSLVVDDPASQPFVTSVGGTRLNVNPISGAYESELVWNDGLGNGAGGGGVSSVWAIPSWQANVSTITSKTHRNVPDVSLNADTYTGYSIYHDGQWVVYGGTSCAAPLWAAFTACVNQELAASQKPVLGFANPALYAIGIGSSYTENFHDITSGNNLYYSASSGYDNASGWGSFNGANLFASLTNSISSSPHLDITMKHPAPFVRGGIGKYIVVVPNHSNVSTSGTVSVVITLPKDLTYRSFTGPGWTFDSTTLTCTRNDALEPGSSYPPITLKVDVDPNTPNAVTPSATVSGGGSASDMSTTNFTTVI